LWIEIIVGVNINCEPMNWVVRRELELTIRRVLPCGFIASAQGVASVVERIDVVGSLWLGGTSFFYNQLVDNF